MDSTDYIQGATPPSTAKGDLIEVETLDTRTTARPEHATFKVYKRRFFGLGQLVLLNIIVSWDVSDSIMCLIFSYPGFVPDINLTDFLAVAHLLSRIEDRLRILPGQRGGHQLDEHCLSLCILRCQPVSDCSFSCWSSRVLGLPGYRTMC